MRVKAELEHLIYTKGLATAESLAQRELTASEIHRMPGPVYAWHEQNNRVNVEKALAAPRIKAAEQANAEASKTRRMWDDQATAEETQSALQEVQTFCSTFPQFRGDHVPNREALVNWLRLKNLPVTVKNLVVAFQELGAEGKLILNPSALGIGSETDISGNRLVRHPKLWRLLEPAETSEDQELLAQRKMSATEWRNQHLQEWNVPAKVVEAWEKATATFLAMTPDYLPTDENGDKMRAFIRANGMQVNPQSLKAAYDYLKPRGELELNDTAIVYGQTTKMVDYGEQFRGLQLPDKESLRHKIHSMSASEYQAWLQNPANRRAADAGGR